ncbi:MAG: DUF4143 domain-containing protein [Clostridia bacterium]|nr:DUF4143 domain-containing protein [Clostridia bacterium]
MAYIKRHIEETLLEAASEGCGLTLCGPHMAGKRTTLERLFPGREIMSAEGYTDALRIEGTSPDAGEKTFRLLGLSMRELAGDDFREPFIPAEEYLSRRNTKIRYDDSKLEDRFDLLADVMRGCLPVLRTEEKYTRVPSRDFNSYRIFDKRDGAILYAIFWNELVDEYRDRLVQEGVPSAAAANYFLYIRAFFCYSNPPDYDWYSSMTKEPVENIKSLFERFAKDDLVWILRPLEENTSRPVDPAHKVHYLDSGMAVNLAAQRQSDYSGQLWPEYFQSYIISEIVKSYCNTGITPELYHFRDPDSEAEVDLVMRFGNDLYPIRIDNGREPFEESLEYLNSFRSFYRKYNVHDGAVICWAREPYRADRHNIVIPFTYI